MTIKRSGYWLSAALLPAALVCRLAAAQDESARPTPPVEPPAASPLTPQPGGKGESMNNRRLGKLLAKLFRGREVEGGPGAWRIDLSKEAEQAPPATDPLPRNGKPRANQEGAAPPHDRDEERAADNEEEMPGAGDRLPAVLIVLTDERADRMRIMIPIRRFNPERAADLRLALIALHANYDRALDARYAVQEGVLWSVFIHPLGSLTTADLQNALAQVQRLRETTGTTFSSSDLLFGGGGGGENPPVDNPEDVI